MQIVKAEILWTRQCPLACSYCSMNTGQTNSRSLDFWKKGLIELKKVGCKFLAIYGAEPLSDFDKLPQFIKIASNLFDLTIITSGKVPRFYKKLKILYEQGLRSLTMSYDIIPLDVFSKTKSNKALKALEYFRTLGPVDNVAVIVTLTRQNYKYLFNTVQTLSKQGIWTFFDIIHPDRGQPGSKAKGWFTELLFTKEDVSLLLIELHKLYSNTDLLVHASSDFVNKLKENPDIITDFTWNCTESKMFPSWITVDYNGIIQPCDDFRVDTAYELTDIFNKWDEIKSVWAPCVKDCPGCAWNTHIDAHFIKENIIPINKYIHK